MLTNTAKTAPFDHRRTHPILGKKTQCFKCNQWDQVESDFILSFIHLRVRKMYFNAFLITLCSKIDSIWVCSSGPVMDSPHDLIEFIKNLNIEILWFFLHKLKIVFLSKLWNKKWGSPCSFVLQSWRCSEGAHHLLSTFPFLSEDWGEFLWNTRRDSRPSIERTWKESSKERHLWYFIVNTAAVWSRCSLHDGK